MLAKLFEMARPLRFSSRWPVAKCSLLHERTPPSVLLQGLEPNQQPVLWLDYDFQESFRHLNHGKGDEGASE